MDFPFKMDAAQAGWNQYINDYKAFLNSGKIRTIIHDTSTESWELLRIARLGKLIQVMPINYAAVNMEYREMVRLAYDSSVNLVLINKVKKEYVNDQATGKYVRAGFGDTGFLVQVAVKAFKDREGFKLQILNCRPNPEVEGQILQGDKATFLGLAMTIFPESQSEDWT